MADTTTQDSATAGEHHPDMDYPQHEATWKAFTAMVYWGTIASLIILVALYCFIVVAQPLLGTLLLLILPAGAVWLFVTRSGSKS